MFILQRVNLDWDDYVIGAPYDKVGPFGSSDEAWDWAVENNYCEHKHARGVRVVDPLSTATPPKKWKKQ